MDSIKNAPSNGAETLMMTIMDCYVQLSFSDHSKDDIIENVKKILLSTNPEVDFCQ